MSGQLAQMYSSVRNTPGASVAGVLAFATGFAVLVGWAADENALKRIAPHFVAMNPMTAMCFAVLGLSLLPVYASRVSGVRHAAGTFVLFVGLLKLADVLLGTRFAIDGYVFASRLGSVGQYPMAESTAIMFMLMGGALTALSLTKRWAILSGQILATASLLQTFIAVLGYLYGEFSFYSMGYFPMAPHTAVAGLLVSIGLLSLHPRGGWMKVLTCSDLGGATARRLLPCVIGIPLVLGWIWLYAQQTGSVSPVMGVALFAASNILLLAVIVAWISGQLHVVSQKLRVRAHQLERTQARLRAAASLLRDRNACLESEVAKRTAELQCIQEVTIHALASLAESRDNETGNHIRRTQHYVRLLAKWLQPHPRFALTDAVVDLMFKSAPLHDIGKVGIPDHILLKPGPLTRDEFEIMKAHPEIGRDAIARAERMLGTEVDFLRFAKEMAYCHQEKWDGSGYPQGLSGESIPISARLMAVADVYDALTSRRVYKPPLSHSEAVAIIRDGRGGHFDPDVVDAFIEINAEFRRIASQYADPYPAASDEVVLRVGAR